VAFAAPLFLHYCIETEQPSDKSCTFEAVILAAPSLSCQFENSQLCTQNF
jgi:hypothetical protein